MHDAPHKRCVCGRSERFPLCDGSHRDEGWACAADPPALAPWAVVAGPRLANVAQQLAAQLGGVAWEAEPLRALRGVVLTDGLDAHELAFALGAVEARSWRVCAVGLDPAALPAALRSLDAEPVVLEADPIGSLWRRVVRALAQPAAPSPKELAAPLQAPRLFLSHAALDEPALLPAIAYLRAGLGCEVFVCVDSIPTGAGWFDELREALDACDRFVWVASPHARRSTFCAFEFGYALAAGKPLGVLSLDAEPLPAWAQRWQAVELPRLARLHPWLDPQEALLQALLQACGLAR
jgi:hypothetical protein